MYIHMYVHTQADATKCMTLRCIHTQGNQHNCRFFFNAVLVLDLPTQASCNIELHTVLLYTLISSCFFVTTILHTHTYMQAAFTQKLYNAKMDICCIFCIVYTKLFYQCKQDTYKPFCVYKDQGTCTLFQKYRYMYPSLHMRIQYFQVSFLKF